MELRPCPLEKSAPFDLETYFLFSFENQRVYVCMCVGVLCLGVLHLYKQCISTALSVLSNTETMTLKFNVQVEKETVAAELGKI